MESSSSSPQKVRPAVFLSPRRLSLHNLSPSSRSLRSNISPSTNDAEPPTAARVPSYLSPDICGYGETTCLPSEARQDLIRDFPQISMAHLVFPWIVLECPHGPPSNAPARIGWFPTVCVENVNTFYDAAGYRTIYYGLPRTQDPLPRDMDCFKCPGDGDLLRMVGGIPNAIGVEFSYNRLTFTLTSLNLGYKYPSRVGGIFAQYKTEDSGPTRDLSPESQRRMTEFISNKIRDDTDYWPILHPGIMLHDKTRSSTAGLLLRNKATGQLCVTGSNCTFPSDEVFHGERKIGTIKHRFPESDICLFELASEVEYTNSNYFEAGPPTSLIEQPPNEGPNWVECDSITTGLQHFMLTGRQLKLREPYNLRDDFRLGVDMQELERMVSYRGGVAVGSLRLESSTTAPGIRGSPVQLMNGPLNGVCLGLFGSSNNMTHYFADVGFLIDGGWELVKEPDNTETSIDSGHIAN